MLKRLFTLILLFGLLLNSGFAQINAPRPCGNPDAYKNSKIKEYSAGGKYFESWLSKIEKEESARMATDEETIYTIPVVVHVLHNGEAEGEGKNLSFERVQSQIEILNNDFGKLPGTPGFNTNPVGVDTRIRFCLATTDPNGQPTNGVVRINTQRDGFDFNTDNGVLKGFSFWDPEKYLNIWTVKLNGNQYIGYAQYPFIQPQWSDSLPFPQPVPDVQPDGVVAEYRVFGNVPAGQSGPFPSYNKGRTITHEIGHYLGLLHIWGDAGGCSDPLNTDYCDDTPKQANYTSGCPANVNSCTSGVLAMKENYLDYTNDACMNIFTADQKKRMRIVMRNCVRRKTLLLNPNICQVTTDTQIIPDPDNLPKEIKDLRFYYKYTKVSSDTINIRLPDSTTVKSIKVFDFIGRPIAILGLVEDNQVIMYINKMKAGVYVSRIEASDGRVWVRKFMKE